MHANTRWTVNTDLSEDISGWFWLTRGWEKTQSSQQNDISSWCVTKCCVVACGHACGAGEIRPIGGTVALQWDSELHSWNTSRWLARGPAAARWLSSAAAAVAAPTLITCTTGLERTCAHQLVKTAAAATEASSSSSNNSKPHCSYRRKSTSTPKKHPRTSLPRSSARFHPPALLAASEANRRLLSSAAVQGDVITDF